MNNKIVWLVLSCLIALMLVVASCGAAVENGEEVVTPTGEEEGVVEEVVEEEEEVVEEVVEEEEEAGGVVTPPSPETVSIDIELEVDSTSPEGVKFVAPENGLYEITIVGGASLELIKTDPNWSIYGGWRARLILYINKPVEWGNPTELGQQPNVDYESFGEFYYPLNWDYELGSDETYPTPAEAEVASQGASVTVNLDEGGYIIVLQADVRDYYYDNSGIITIRITGP